MKYAALTGFILALGSVELWAQAFGLLLILVAIPHLQEKYK